MRGALAAAVVALAVAAPAAAAQAPDYTIKATGSKNGLGKVSAIGPYKLDTEPSLDEAIAALGQPSSRAQTDTLCRAGWRNLGLRISFVNFGGGDACQFGKVQSVRAFGRIWKTTRGLAVGSPVKTLRKLYPGAPRKKRTYRLIGANSIFTDGSRYSVLAAGTNGKRVTSFKLFVGAAGE